MSVSNTVVKPPDKWESLQNNLKDNPSKLEFGP